MDTQQPQTPPQPQPVPQPQPAPQPGQTVIVNHVEKKSNPLGVTGFVLALITLFLGWIPVLGWILWILGLIFSFIGVFKTPKGLAIAGLVISLIDIIIIFVLAGTLAAAIGMGM